MEITDARHRLPSSRVLNIWVVLATGVLTIAALTLSDRVPVFIDAITALIDPRLNHAVDALLDLGHIFVWALMAFLTVWLLESSRSRVAVILVLAVSATALELAQAVASATRSSTIADAQSNLIGLTFGAVLGLLLTIDARAVRPSPTP